MCVRDFLCAWPIDAAARRTAVSPFPSDSAAEPVRRNASGHDIGMQQVMHGLLEGLPGGQRQHEVARMVASLQMKVEFGHPIGKAACWTSWADALPLLETRLFPSCSDRRNTPQQWEAQGCNRGGFVTRPTWSELRAGTRPTSVSSSEFGEAGTVGSVPLGFSFGGP